MSVEIALAASILSLIAAAIRLLNDVTLGKRRAFHNPRRALRIFRIAYQEWNVPWRDWNFSNY
ncbi:hypothetical protein KEJ36_05855 [Candidatus Bathyarchaeota archaeon]|nr:hypothetical protein [Candidatus Bathyarchaeota archaeon]MBS7628305.1 hypothetical protein [Candidatus Bathyarchaeota archaeon]